MHDDPTNLASDPHNEVDILNSGMPFILCLSEIIL
jgi:hypothetical protein